MGKVEALEVLSPGSLTTVQDMGRYGFGRYGVPPSGALDTFSLRIANLLVGNHETEAGLEITVMGLRVRALTDLVIAVTGADLHPHLNEKPFEMWRSERMRKEDVLQFRLPRSGCRAYLAVGGGILTAPVLGSRSTNLISGFGGHLGRPLKAGDILYAESHRDRLKNKGNALDPNWIPLYPNEWSARILWGPQDEDFTEETRRLFVESSFSVTPKSDRTGIRLAGQPIPRKEGTSESIISEGVVPGSIQIPGDAQPIIILAETVTGGYRKIGTVISADFPLLAQIMPGDRVRFRSVSMEDALSALRQLELATKAIRAHG